MPAWWIGLMVYFNGIVAGAAIHLMATDSVSALPVAAVCVSIVSTVCLLYGLWWREPR